MCTVTIIPTPHGFRVASNRDESRRRPAALPPVVVARGGRRALMPVDPAGGGTWIAANDRGIVFTLLNYNRQLAPCWADASAASSGALSRGTIIPELLDCDDASSAARRVTANVDPAQFGPFRLLIVDARHRIHLLSDGSTIASDAEVVDGRSLLLASSGLGDSLVEPPRRALFEQTLTRCPSAEAQDAFHAHEWPERRHLSVRMSRADARTISYTTVDVSTGRVVMLYRALPDRAGGGEVVDHVAELELPIAAARP